MSAPLGTCNREGGHFPHIQFDGCENWQPRPPHVCDVTGCEQAFPTLDEVIEHERSHRPAPLESQNPPEEPNR